MKTQRSKSIEFNFHITKNLSLQVARLQGAGLNLSAVARLAIRKCATLPLDEEDDTPRSRRILLYLHVDEAKLLDELAAQEGYRSRARTLRRLITTFLRIYAPEIDRLF